MDPTDTNDASPPSAAKKRPRSNQVSEPQQEEDDNPQYAAVDANLGDEEKARYKEVLEAMSRFAERGLIAQDFDADGNGNDGVEAETDKAGTKATGENEEKGENGASVPATKKAKKTRRQRKEEARGHIARLKALAEDPEAVDAWDVTALDPLLLVALKSWPNTVGVPGNWRQKRKYLQNKRGMEKRAFVLPSYIADTGVGGLRDAQLESDAGKTLKQKQREKMRAKTGRGVEIDEVVLRDAFFKFQSKPRLTGPGDLYYELREMQVDASNFRPGAISPALRAALGIGPDDPPPWLVNMQRFGPPPGYPGLKIPGLNAPIPRGAVFGYHIGGWGKPPVDMTGKPIYGDVFGEGIEYQTSNPRFDPPISEKRFVWGEIKKDDIFQTRSTVIRTQPNQVQNEPPVALPPPPAQTPMDVETPAPAPPTTAVPAPVPEEVAPPPPPPPEDTTDEITEQVPPLHPPGEGIELRKGVPAGQLYTVLEEKKRTVGRTDMYGSAHGYVMPGSAGAGASGSAGKDGTTTDRVMADAVEKEPKRRTAKKKKSFKF